MKRKVASSARLAILAIARADMQLYALQDLGLNKSNLDVITLHEIVDALADKVIGAYSKALGYMPPKHSARKDITLAIEALRNIKAIAEVSDLGFSQMKGVPALFHATERKAILAFNSEVGRWSERARTLLGDNPMVGWLHGMDVPGLDGDLSLILTDPVDIRKAAEAIKK